MQVHMVNKVQGNNNRFKEGRKYGKVAQEISSSTCTSHRRQAAKKNIEKVYNNLPLLNKAETQDQCRN